MAIENKGDVEAELEHLSQKNEAAHHKQGLGGVVARESVREDLHTLGDDVRERLKQKES